MVVVVVDAAEVEVASVPELRVRERGAVAWGKNGGTSVSECRGAGL